MDRGRENYYAEARVFERALEREMQRQVAENHAALAISNEPHKE